VTNQVISTGTVPRVHGAAAQPAQPSNPTVPFGPGAVLTKSAPMFSLGQTLAVSWGVPPATEPVTYDVVIESEDMIQGLLNSTGRVFMNLVPSHSAQTAVLLPAGAGKTFCFNGGAIDQASNHSPYGGAVCTTTPRPAKNLDKSGKWTKKTTATEFGGGHLEATAGSLSLKEHRAYNAGGLFDPEAGGIFVGHVALVATRCKGCGTVRVTYRSSGVKGAVKKVKAISLDAASNKPNQIIPVVSFPSKKTDFNEDVEVTIEITSHRKPVRIEGLGVSAL
jgi:hypothetical protein